MLLATLPRYMLPTFPLLIAFFLLFVRDGLKETRFAAWTLAASAALSGLSLYLNPRGAPLKIVAGGLILLPMVLLVVLYAKSRNIRRPLVFAPPALIGTLTLAIFLRFTITHPLGQVRNWRLFGSNLELPRILAAFGPDERIWINDLLWHELPWFYSGDRPTSPEWQGHLKAWVPKTALLHRYPDRRVYGFWWKDNGVDLRNRLHEHRIAHVGLVVSDIPNKRRFLPYECYLDWFRDVPWLTFERSIPLQNKTLYIFRYTP